MRKRAMTYADFCPTGRQHRVIVYIFCLLWISLRGLQRIVEKKRSVSWFFHNPITCIKYFHAFSFSRADNKITHM